jgi:hypothetical protein
MGLIALIEALIERRYDRAPAVPPRPRNEGIHSAEALKRRLI